MVINLMGLYFVLNFMGLYFVLLHREYKQYQEKRVYTYALLELNTI